MEKRMNKRAVFFSVLTIFIIMLLMLFVKPYDYSYEYSKLPTNKLRLSHYDNNLKAIENDYLYYAVYDTLIRSMIAYNEFLIKQDKFASSPSNAAHSIKQIMLTNEAIDPTDGVTKISLDGYIDDDLKDGDKDYTLPARISEIESIAENYLNLNLEITLSGSPEGDDIKVYQCSSSSCAEIKETGPWHLGVKVPYHLTLDQSPVAEWDHDRVIYVKVPIFNRLDILYYLNTNPHMSMKYKKSEISGWDFDNFTRFISERAYTKRLTGMSYLQRLSDSYDGMIFEGSNVDLSECCGVESIINRSSSFKDGPETPPMYGYKDLSFVDHCYLSSESTSDNCASPYFNITGISDRFYPLQLSMSQVDYYHLNEYAVQNH